MNSLARKLIPPMIFGGIVAALTMFLTLTFGPQKEAPVFQDVGVTPEALEEQRPDFDRSLIEKLTRENAELKQRAISLGSALDRVNKFCKPAVEAAVAAAENDTLIHDNADSLAEATEGPRVVPSERLEIPEEDLVAVIEAVRIKETSWLNPLAKRQVEVYGINNAGDEFRDLYMVAPSGEIEVGVQGNETVVEGPRLGWTKPLITLGEGILIGVAVGAVLSIGD